MSKIARWLTLLFVSLSSGCATISTLHADKPNAPLIYAGTRLDWYALNDGCCPTQRFGTVAPTYPLVDLPFSALLDTLFLPFSLAAEAGIGLVVRGGN